MDHYKKQNLKSRRNQTLGNRYIEFFLNEALDLISGTNKNSLKIMAINTLIFIIFQMPRTKFFHQKTKIG